MTQRTFALFLLSALAATSLPTASAQEDGPFSAFRPAVPDLSAHSVLRLEIDETLAADIERAVAADDALRLPGGGRDVIAPFLLSSVGYVLGGALGYGAGYLIDPGVDQLFSGPGAVGLMFAGAIGSAVGAHHASRERGSLGITAAGAVVANVLVLLVASTQYGSGDIYESGALLPAAIASPLVSISTSVTLEHFMGGR